LVKETGEQRGQRQQKKDHGSKVVNLRTSRVGVGGGQRLYSAGSGFAQERKNCAQQ